MVDCSHCAETFPDEEAYVTHLTTDHETDLTRIDKRRIEKHPAVSVPDPDEVEDPDMKLIALQTAINLIFLAIAAGMLYLLYYAAANGLIY